MKVFKLKYGENKEKIVCISSVEFLNMVYSKAPIWQPQSGSKRKSLANETKRECWRQIARKLVGRQYIAAPVKDRVDIEHGLKSRFHAMRDQWVKCRNRNRSYAFEEHIKFLDTKMEFEGDTDGDNTSDNNNQIVVLSEEDDDMRKDADFQYIVQESPTIMEDHFMIDEEHIRIEVAQTSTATVATSGIYQDDGTASSIKRYPPSPSPPPQMGSDESKDLPLQLCSPALTPPPPPSTEKSAAHQHCKRADSPSAYSCSCRCHKDAESVKQMENFLFGKAVATLLNNLDGAKLFETKKAILSCIVKDIYIVDPSKK